MSYTITVEVSGQPHQPSNMWTAVAQVWWDQRVQNVQTYTTPAQHSYSRARAISYALAEVGLAFERGEIP